MHPSESLILEFSGNVATSSTSIPLQPDLPECMASSVAVTRFSALTSGTVLKMPISQSILV